MKASIETRGFALDEIQNRHIHHQLDRLDQRLVHRSEPSTSLLLKSSDMRRQIDADLRLRLSPKGPTLVSHQTADTAEHVVRLAVEDVDRQLERRVEAQRGSASFGVPSRREPTALRPHPIVEHRKGD